MNYCKSDSLAVCGDHIAFKCMKGHYIANLYYDTWISAVKKLRLGRP